jgi:hypothetical protein
MTTATNMDGMSQEIIATTVAPARLPFRAFDPVVFAAGPPLTYDVRRDRPAEHMQRRNAMRKRHLPGMATGLLLTAACIGSASANIIDDTYGAGAGSFELGGGFVANQYNFMPLAQGSTSITGWTVGGPGGGVDWLLAPYWTADTGKHSVDLQQSDLQQPNWPNNGPDNGSIATIIPTSPGQTYRLTFGAATYAGYYATGEVARFVRTDFPVS